MEERKRRGIVRAVPASVMSLAAQAFPTVAYPPVVVKQPPSDLGLLTFLVYDGEGQEYLGAITHRPAGSYWVDELNASGSGNVSLYLTDPLFKETNFGFQSSVVVAHLEGEPVFAWRVQGGEGTVVGGGEDSDRTIDMAGPGLLEDLKLATVRPDSWADGEPNKSAQERRFGYMSRRESEEFIPPFPVKRKEEEDESWRDSSPGPFYADYRSGQPSWYVAEDWRNDFVAVAKKRIKKGPFEIYPQGWPDKNADVLWLTDPNRPGVPGVTFWRSSFTLDKAYNVTIYASADDRFELYLDGVKIMEELSQGLAYTNTYEWTGKLRRGKHLLAAMVVNDEREEQAENWGGFILSVMRIDKNGVPKLPALYNTRKSRWRVFYEGSKKVPYKDKTKTVQRKVQSKKKTQHYYTVVKGDTLTRIGKKYGIAWRKIYEANKELIDNDPRIALLPTKPPGWWIFPGMKLAIPGKYDYTATEKVVEEKKTTRVWQAAEPLTTPRPGWFPYQILTRLIAEARARNVFSLRFLHFTYQGGKDSSGVYWPDGDDDRQERAFSVGTSVYDAAQELIESGMDIRMHPYTDGDGEEIYYRPLPFSAYNFLGEDRTDPHTGFYLLDRGYSTLSYKVSPPGLPLTTLMVQTDDGWRDYLHESGLEEWGRTEAQISVGGVDPDSVMNAVGAAVEELSTSKTRVVTEFVYGPGRRAYKDFDIGDLVIAHNLWGKTFNARITSISLREVQENVIHVTVEAEGEDTNRNFQGIRRLSQSGGGI